MCFYQAFFLISYNKDITFTLRNYLQMSEHIVIGQKQGRSFHDQVYKSNNIVFKANKSIENPSMVNPSMHKKGLSHQAKKDVFIMFEKGTTG